MDWRAPFDTLRDLLRLQVVESPYMPEGQFLLYQASPVDDFTQLPIRLEEPLWPPAPPLPFHLPDLRWRDEPVSMGRDVYERERQLALDHLAGLLDDTCDELGFDREVWRGPRRDETRRLFWERQQVALRAEARVAFSIMRPETLVKVLP